MQVHSSAKYATVVKVKKYVFQVSKDHGLFPPQSLGSLASDSFIGLSIPTGGN